MLVARIVATVGPLLVVISSCSLHAAEPRSAADLLPPTVVAFAEMAEPAKFVDLVLNHPVRQQLDALEGIQQAYDSPQFLQLKAIVSVIEAQLGKPWPALIKSAAAGGVAVAVDAPSQGAVVVITAEDHETPADMLESLTNLLRADAAANGKPEPIETRDYRGLTVYRVGEARVAVLGHSLIATNKAELGQRIVDMHLDASGETLSQSDLYRRARRQAAEPASVWGYVDTEALRQAGVAKELFAGRAENPVLEVLVGGILTTLAKTPLVTISVTLTEAELKVDLGAPHDPAWVGEERAYYYGPDGQGSAPPLLHVKDELLAVSSYRNLSEMWLRAGDLFDEATNDQLAQAESNLATLFSGKDFGEEVLGAIGPELQFVVARQSFDDGPRPAIQLPSFALAVRLIDAETIRPEFRRTFQSLIGFLNVVGAMNGQPQLDLDMEKSADRQLITATYVAEEGANMDRLPINFNFSPSIGFAGDRLIVSSTKELAKELVDLVAIEGQEVPPRSNTWIQADLASLRQILDDNRGQLVAQNMLSEGHTKEEAEQEIGTLLDILRAGRDASVRLTPGDDVLHLTFELNFSRPENPKTR